MADRTPTPEASIKDDLREHMKHDDPAEIAATAADELAAQGAEIERLRAETESLQDQLLRRAAEFQNYRRRTEADRAEADARARAAVLTPLLDVFDDLQRSLEAARQPGTAPDALGQGVELVTRKFEDALARFGVARIAAAGQPFSEAEHEAVFQQPAPEGIAAGSVLAEVQPGYRLGERVLRHARVIVAQ